MNKIKSYQCAVFCSVSCHVIELPIAPHFINRKMIIATFYLLLSALKVGFRWILGRFKVGYYRKRRSPLGRFFWIFCELTPVCTLVHHVCEINSKCIINGLMHVYLCCCRYPIHCHCCWVACCNILSPIVSFLQISRSVSTEVFLSRVNSLIFIWASSSTNKEESYKGRPDIFWS